MTFEQYQAECRSRQGDYIKREQHRMAAAKKLWRTYERAMREIGLHALTPNEIQAREDQLHQMRAVLDTKFTDSPQMRALYALQVAT